MAISRPLLLALLGAVLLGVTFYAVQNARTGSSDDAAPAAQSQPEQQATAPAAEPAAVASPEETLDAALNLAKVDSAAFTAAVSARGGGERARIEISGAFQLGAANDLPELELSAEGTAPDGRFEGGLTAVDDAAWFTQGKTAWRVPDEIWSPLVEAAANGGARPQDVALPFDPQGWVRDVESEGAETLDGVETTHVSASIDAERAVRDLRAADATGSLALPGRADAARAVKGAELDAWVGADDGILRRLAVDVAVAGRGQRGRLSLDVRLTGVNQPQEIEAPADVSRGLPDGRLGELVEGLVGGLSEAGGGQPVSLDALRSPNPRKAARAVEAGKRVVILFRNPDGLDDRAMAKVMRALDRRTQAVVLTDHVDAVDRYGKLVEDLGVSQTPSVVLIDRAGKARLIEGYADTDTLAQAVADAR